MGVISPELAKSLAEYFTRKLCFGSVVQPVAQRLPPESNAISEGKNEAGKSSIKLGFGVPLAARSDGANLQICALVGGAGGVETNCSTQRLLAPSNRTAPGWKFIEVMEMVGVGEPLPAICAGSNSMIPFAPQSATHKLPAESNVMKSGPNISSPVFPTPRTTLGRTSPPFAIRAICLRVSSTMCGKDDKSVRYENQRFWA